MTWDEFYKKRVGKSYSDYFAERYAIFLMTVMDWFPSRRTIFSSYNILVEIGCGIGTAGICLLKLNSGPDKVIFTDISEEMLALTRKNLKLHDLDSTFCHTVEQQKIPNFVPGWNCYSHGVLEHFPPYVVKRYLAKLKAKGINSIHYVPTDKYKYKSFGDERLWSVERWMEIANPRRIRLFNDDKDLVLVC